MYKKLTLKNDFHNTEANFRIQHDGKIEVDDVIKLSMNQVKKAKRLLCCDDCQCSGTLGTRSDWHKLAEEEVKLEENIQYDRMGNITGADLIIHQIW